MISKIDNKKIQGQLLYEIGMNKFKNNDLASAEMLLKHFLKRHKKHHKIGQVASILSKIREQGVFQNRHIGALLPLTGFYKKAGEKALRAITLAVDEFNQTNLRGKFILHVRDSRSTPEHAVKQINVLKKENVSCIIGPMVTAREAAVESQRLKVPMIALSQQQGVPFMGNYIFRNYLTPQLQVKSTLLYLIENYNVNRFAILFPNEKYGHVFSQIFKKMVSSYQGDITDSAMYEPDQTDFSRQILSLIRGYKRLEPDGSIVHVRHHREKLRHKPYQALIDFEVLFIPDTMSKFTAIVTQLKYHDVDGVMVVGTSLLNTERPMEIKGIDLPQIIFPGGFNGNSADKNVQRFMSSYQHRFQKPPGYIEAAAYETAWILMQSLLQPAVDSPQDLIKTLKKQIYPSPVGCPLTFSRSGEAMRNLYLFNLHKDGKPVTVQSCGKPAF